MNRKEISKISWEEFARIKKEHDLPKGRPQKYKTEEERQEALKLQRREAVKRYQAKKKLSTVLKKNI
jgi:hypothetical protein